MALQKGPYASLYCTSNHLQYITNTPHSSGLHDLPLDLFTKPCQCFDFLRSHQ